MTADPYADIFALGFILCALVVVAGCGYLLFLMRKHPRGLPGLSRPVPRQGHQPAPHPSSDRIPAPPKGRIK